MTTKQEWKFLEVYFDGKPDETVRTQLKANGFRWFPPKTCWTKFNGKQEDIAFLDVEKKEVVSKKIQPDYDPFPDGRMCSLVDELVKKDKLIAELRQVTVTPSRTDEFYDEVWDLINRIEEKIEYNNRYAVQSWNLSDDILRQVKDILDTESIAIQKQFDKIALSINN